jgi:hypothetical protein
MKQAAAKARATTRPNYLDSKALIARMVERALERNGQPIKAVADDMDTDAPNVCRWGKAHEPNGPHIKHLLAAAGTASHGVAVDIYRALGDELGEQSIPRVDVVHETDAARLAVLSVECTDVPRTFAVAIADGALTEEEIEHIRQQGRESVAAVLELDAYLTREQLRRRGAR